VDRNGILYIEHPARVAERCESTVARAAAWLHDVLEDTDWTEAALLARGVHPLVIETVALVSRVPGETYRDWIARLAATDSLTGRYAREVKLADLDDNASRPSVPTLASIVEKRYLPAARVLLSACDRCGERPPKLRRLPALLAAR
jgi:hypothetical protein